MAEFHGRTEEFLNRLRPALVAGGEAMGEVVLNEWQALFRLPKTGRTYFRGKSTAVHRASAPGEPPAVDFANLTQSLAHEVRVEGEELEVKVGPRGPEMAKRLYWLEFGTAIRRKRFTERRPGFERFLLRRRQRRLLGAQPAPLNRMAPRPSARPAFMNAKPKLAPRFAAVVRQQLGL